MAKTIDQLTALSAASTDQFEIQRAAGGVSGKVTLQDIFAVLLGGAITWTPGTSVDPSEPGAITLEFTSDSLITIKGMGSDNVVRKLELPIA